MARDSLGKFCGSSNIPQMLGIRNGGQGISIAVVFHSLDSTLHVLIDQSYDCNLDFTLHSSGVRERMSSVSIDMALRRSAGSRDREVAPTHEAEIRDRVKISIAVAIRSFNLLQMKRLVRNLYRVRYSLT